MTSTTRPLPYLLFAWTCILVFLNVGLRYDIDFVWDEAMAYYLPLESSTLVPAYHFLVRCCSNIGFRGPLALWLLSGIGMSVAILGIWRLLRYRIYTMRALNPTVLVFAGLTAVVQAAYLGVHATSGTATSWAMAWFAIWLILFLQAERKLTIRKAIGLGLLGGTGLFVWPELLLFTLGLPLALLIFSRKGTKRQRSAYLVTSTTVAIIGAAFISQYYSGFYFPHSDPGPDFDPLLREELKSEALRQGFIFLALNVVPIACTVFALGRRYRAFWRRFSIADKSLLTIFLVYWIYVTFGQVQLNGASARYYYPAWPALMYLGGRTLALLLRDHATLASRPISRLLTIVAVLVGTALSIWRLPRDYRGPEGRESFSVKYENAVLPDDTEKNGTFDD